MTIADAIQATWRALGLVAVRSVSGHAYESASDGSPSCHVLVQAEDDEVRAVAARVGWIVADVAHDGRRWVQTAGNLVEIDVTVMGRVAKDVAVDDAGVVL